MIQLFYQNNEKQSYEVYYDKLLKNSSVFTTEECPIIMVTMSTPKDLLQMRSSGKKIIFRTPHITSQNIAFITFAVKICDYLIFQSNFMLQVYTNYFGVIEKPYIVVHNACEKTVICAKNNKILICGDFIQHSNRALYETNKVATLERTLAWIAGKYNITVAGTIPEYVKIPDGIEVIRHGIMQVDLDALRKTHGIYMHTVLFDNCPNTLLESMSSGMKCIGYRSGAIPELLDSKFVCDFSQVCLNKLIENIIFDDSTLKHNQIGFDAYSKEVLKFVEEKK